MNYRHYIAVSQRLEQAKMKQSLLKEAYRQGKTLAFQRMRASSYATRNQNVGN